MIFTKRIVLIFFLLCFCIVFDQTTKIVAKNKLSTSPPQSYVNNIFRLQYAENKGAFLSFGNRWHKTVNFYLLSVFPGLFLMALLFYIIFYSRNNSFKIAALSLIIGGGSSNIFDRFFNDDRVIDFMGYRLLAYRNI